MGHYHKGKYKTELIEINGRFLLKSLLQRWTPLAKECYERGCNCDGCSILPKLESDVVCKIKDYVRGYILKGMYPSEDEDDNNN
jgi:hypothetical protein